MRLVLSKRNIARNSILKISLLRSLIQYISIKAHFTILIQFLRTMLFAKIHLLDISVRVSQLNYRSNNAILRQKREIRLANWRRSKSWDPERSSVVLSSPPQEEIVQTQRETVPPPRRFDPRYYRGRALATLLAVETFHPLTTTNCDVRIDLARWRLSLHARTLLSNAPLEAPLGKLLTTLRPSNWISIHSVGHRR